jgi:uncharacterized protein (TIGR02001 family)
VSARARLAALWPWTFAGALLHAGAAFAQLSGSVAVVSDYRYRGVSLSNDRPAVQAGVAYDHDSGLYGGAFGSNVDVGRDALLTIVYAGFARRLRPDLSWDCGVSRISYSGSSQYNYGEVFCGVASDRVSAKVFYSPDYLGLDARSVYAEVNAALPVRDRLTLIAHAGWLRAFDPRYADGYDGRRVDLRAGASLDVDWSRIQLAWVGNVLDRSTRPVRFGRHRNTVVLSVSRQF